MKVSDDSGKKTIQVKKSLLSENDRVAQINRRHFDEKGVVAINLISSPGSGKTTLLEKTIEALKDAEKNTILGVFSTNASKYGVIEHRKGRVMKIIEKMRGAGENLVFTGIALLGPEIFTKIELALEQGVYELPRVLNMMENIGLRIADCLWKDAIYPWDLLELNSWALRGVAKEISGKVEPSNIIGDVEIGEGTVISGGTYIRGPVRIGKNCYIGPNSVILPDTSIGNDVSIGAQSFIKNSVIMSSTSIAHRASIENSVIGRSLMKNT